MLKEKVIEKLKNVEDPEVRMSVLDLKITYDIEVDEENGIVNLKYRPTTPFCPIGVQLAGMIKEALLEIDEVKDVKMEIIDFMYKEQAEEYINAIKKEDIKKENK